MPEPVFVDLLRRPGIDSQPGGPVRQPYFSSLLARLHRLAKSIPRNRFLGSINVYKYGLRLKAFRTPSHGATLERIVCKAVNRGKFGTLSGNSGR
jgi:hypothetical protein